MKRPACFVRELLPEAARKNPSGVLRLASALGCIPDPPRCTTCWGAGLVRGRRCLECGGVGLDFASTFYPSMVARAVSEEIARLEEEDHDG